MMVIRSLVRFASKLAKRCRNIMRAHIIASGAFRRLFQEDKLNKFFFSPPRAFACFVFDAYESRARPGYKLQA